MERGHVGATGGPSGSASQSGCVQFCKFIRLNIYDLCIFLDLRQTSIKFAQKTSHLLKERDQPGGYITPGRKISSLRRVGLKTIK